MYCSGTENIMPGEKEFVEKAGKGSGKNWIPGRIWILEDRKGTVLIDLGKNKEHGLKNWANELFPPLSVANASALDCILCLPAHLQYWSPKLGQAEVESQLVSASKGAGVKDPERPLQCQYTQESYIFKYSLFSRFLEMWTFWNSSDKDERSSELCSECFAMVSISSEIIPQNERKVLVLRSGGH